MVTLVVYMLELFISVSKFVSNLFALYFQTWSGLAEDVGQAFPGCDVSRNTGKHLSARGPLWWHL